MFQGNKLTLCLCLLYDFFPCLNSFNYISGLDFILLPYHMTS